MPDGSTTHRMAYYMEYSTRIYQVYLKYIVPEDIVVYSIDEVFISHRLFTRKKGTKLVPFLSCKNS